MQHLPHPDTLRRLYTYDSATGELCHRHYTGGIQAGELAGYVDAHGYIRVHHCGKNYAAHRIIWAYVTGAWPTMQIDHINGVKTDNSWANLRQVTAQQNSYNRRKAMKNSKTGVLGVGVRADGKFRARIRVAGKRIELGAFDTIEEAQSVYVAAKKKYHGV